MGILPIGFFSPLPLAMMIPFMATQSLAMGEAFGKSFQYGKRKISSMTNEEFNKLTFADLMTEQTANIKAIIPQLKQQMSMSQDMQKAIFQEMIQLIPTFFESFKKSLPSDLTETSYQASPPPAIQEIRYAGRTESAEETQARIDAALKLFEDNFLKQQGTKESLAEKLAAQNPPPPPPTYTTPPEKKIASKKVLSAAEDPVYLAWITSLGKLKADFTTRKNHYLLFNDKLKNIKLSKGNVGYQSIVSSYKKEIASAWSWMFDIQTKIRGMSNDYRNPNNHIRENAVRLRQEIASGQWLRQKYKINI